MQYPSHKLIWQSNAPAKYESSWSLFAKLLAMNVITPIKLASLISNHQSPKRTLRFWDSSWIDLDKLSKLLDVETSLISTGFLNNFILYNPPDIDYEPVLGIKFCPECLKKGFHSIFFQFTFIKYCPWHNLELTPPCNVCVSAISSEGLLRNSILDWSTYSTECGHFQFNDSKVPLLNQLSFEEQNIVNKTTEEFLQWWSRVVSCVEIGQVLSKSVIDNDRRENLPKYLAAAELIAGKCPWKISDDRYSVKTVRWFDITDINKRLDYRNAEVQQTEEYGSILRQSEADKNYRALRRYFFRKYIKTHRCCWNELSNYNYAEAQNLSSDSFCIVTVAFIAWRLSIENYLNLEALKVGKFNDRPIKEVSIYAEGYIKTVKSQLALMYAHFYYIWESVSLLSENQKFGVALRNHLEVSNFAYGNHKNEWAIIVPDDKWLVSIAKARCVNTSKFDGWMQQDKYIADWHLEHNAFASWDNRLIFKVYNNSNRRGGYKYVNV